MPSITIFDEPAQEDLDLLVITETINNTPNAIVVAGLSDNGRNAIAQLLEHGEGISLQDRYHPSTWAKRRSQQIWEARLPMAAAASIASRLKQQGLRVEATRVDL